VTQLDPDKIVLSGISTQTIVGHLLQKNLERLKENAKKLSGPVTLNDGGIGLMIRFNEGIKVDDAKLTLNTNESYILQIGLIDGQVNLKRSKTS